MANDETLIDIARSWRATRDGFVKRHEIAAGSFAATPGFSQRQFMEAHEAHGQRLLHALPKMDAETFEAFRELVSVIPSLLQRRT